MAKRKTAHETASLPALVPERIDRSILVIRGQKVLLDEQLAAFYNVETKRLVEAVKRNAISSGFPRTSRSSLPARSGAS